jgi:hypothetical protein
MTSASCAHERPFSRAIVAERHNRTTYFGGKNAVPPHTPSPRPEADSHHLIMGTGQLRQISGMSLLFLKSVLMLDNQQQIVAIRDLMVPDETAGFALLHPDADRLETIGKAHRT